MKLKKGQEINSIDPDAKIKEIALEVAKLSGLACKDAIDLVIKVFEMMEMTKDITSLVYVLRHKFNATPENMTSTGAHVHIYRVQKILERMK